MKDFGTCHYCGQQIWTQQCKITTARNGEIRRYHFGDGVDCLSDENRAIRIIRQMADEDENVAVRGYD